MFPVHTSMVGWALPTNMLVRALETRPIVEEFAVVVSAGYLFELRGMAGIAHLEDMIR